VEPKRSWRQLEKIFSNFLPMVLCQQNNFAFLTDKIFFCSICAHLLKGKRLSPVTLDKIHSECGKQRTNHRRNAL
jgi:hypothetical protein